MTSFSDAAQRIIRGYYRSLKRLTALVALLASASVMSAAIVIPLWIFATRARTGYNIFLGAVILVTIAGALTTRFLRNVRRHGGIGRALGRTFLPFMGKLSRFLIICALIYLNIIIALSGRWSIFVPLVIATLIVIGVIRYLRRA